MIGQIISANTFGTIDWHLNILYTKKVIHLWYNRPTLPIYIKFADIDVQHVNKFTYYLF